LRALGPEGDNADSRWLHYRWLRILDDLFAAVGDALTARREFDAVCMGVGTRNPLALPLLLYLSGARRVWVVEPELDGPAADWRVRWGLQELALRVLTGDVTSRHFVRAAADVAGFADLRALFFGQRSAFLRETSVRIVPRYLEDGGIPAGSIHLVTSRSVLEHVTEIDRCVDTMASMLAPGGVMFHQIDLSAHDARDRFAFYYADATTRERRPDDLNGWRLSDYLTAFEARGLTCQVLDTTIAEEYALDRKRLVPRYQSYTDHDLRCARAVIVCAKSARAAPA
jgi:hypothetical protein